ncbi:MAG: hypothetical protein DRH93_03300 [Deltaproteobacteria bacterium]|nr:MAG: hypothetical protein DRH93_03300 [Deltaproteobacteria bacterium]
MATVQEIINDAAIEIGILVAGGSLGTEDEAWVLRKFNRYLNTLSKEGLNFDIKTREQFTLTSGTKIYSIGVAQDFDTVRPILIDYAYIRINDTDYSCRVRHIDEYDKIVNKASRDGRPYRLYYNPKYQFGEITLFPNPDDSYALHLVSIKPFTTYTLLSATVELPAEYEEVFVLNLAVRIAGRYGRTVSPQTRADAKETHANLKSDNFGDNIRGKIFRSDHAYDTHDGHRFYDIEGDTVR